MGLQPSDLWSDQSKDYSERVLRRLMAIRKMKEYGSTLNEKKGLFILFKEGVLAGAIFNELLNSALSMAMMGKKI